MRACVCQGEGTRVRVHVLLGLVYQPAQRALAGRPSPAMVIRPPAFTALLPALKVQPSVASDVWVLCAARLYIIHTHILLCIHCTAAGARSDLYNVRAVCALAPTVYVRLRLCCLQRAQGCGFSRTLCWLEDREIPGWQPWQREVHTCHRPVNKFII